jgi:hypothetical protein
MTWAAHFFRMTSGDWFGGGIQEGDVVMESERFDAMARAMGVEAPRRAVSRVLVGGALGAIAGRFGLEQAGAKKKKGGKKKGCGGGQKRCGKRCVPKTGCCKSSECSSLRNEYCQKGRCGCAKGAVVHNGRCGFAIDCKTVAQICSSHNECCSGLCTIPNGNGQMRCDRGHLLCITDLDCVSGECRGYVCPEIWNQ